MQLDMSAKAMLVWLTKGTMPSEKDFTAPETPVADLSTPHGKTPETYWVLEDAVTHAIEVMRDHAKEPWIKIEGAILGPAEIRQAYSGLKAMRMFDADGS